MAQGKPILAMINGDGADLVNETNCGYVAPANDVDAFVDAINKMYELSKDELNQLGMNGKKYYEDNFTKEQRIEQLLEILRNKN